jgi:hypothetical protein
MNKLVRILVLSLVVGSVVNVAPTSASAKSWRCWKRGVGNSKVLCEKANQIGADTQTEAAQKCISEQFACCAAAGTVETVNVEVEDLSNQVSSARMPCPKSTGGSRR